MSPRLHPHASAHGKVILFGEHAVVYGCPAIAAGIPRGLELRAEALPDRQAPMQISIPDWQLDLRLTADTEHPVARACLEVLTHADGPIQGWSITGHSTLPCRAGLGSSASLTVALARLVLGPSAQAAEIIECSIAGESVFHGEPSGVDSAMATHGGVMKFLRGEPPQPLELPGELHLAILPTGMPRSTAQLVGGVRERLDRCTSLKGHILHSFSSVCQQAEELLKTHNLKQLGELMDVSHGLLSALGVSSPALDQLCHRARAEGALGAKLTGAGGGGCAIALLDTPTATDLPAHGHPLTEALRDDAVDPFTIAIAGA